MRVSKCKHNVQFWVNYPFKNRRVTLLHRERFEAHLDSWPSKKHLWGDYRDLIISSKLKHITATQTCHSESNSFLKEMTWATRDVNGPITMTAWVFVCNVMRERLRLTVCIKQWLLSSSAYKMPSLMKTEMALRMKDTNKFIWMKFLVQCSFLRADKEILCKM